MAWMSLNGRKRNFENRSTQTRDTVTFLRPIFDIKNLTFGTNGLRKNSKVLIEKMTFLSKLAFDSMIT